MYIKAPPIATVALALTIGVAPPAMADTVITGEGIFSVRGTTAKTFRGDFCRTQECLTVSSFPVSVRSQADLLNRAAESTTGPITVVGYSLSAAAVYDLLEEWTLEPDEAPDPVDTRIVTIGNPRNKWGGSSRSRETGPPEGQPYEHLDITRQYDLVADIPDRFSLYSLLNLSLPQHTYSDVDINAPENLIHKEGNTTYMLIPEPVLPMLKWRDWFTSDERMAELDAKYRPLVERDYDRPDYIEQGEGADWVNESGMGEIDEAEVAEEVIPEAIPEAAKRAEEDIPGDIPEEVEEPEQETAPGDVKPDRAPDPEPAPAPEGESESGSEVGESSTETESSQEGDSDESGK